MLIRGITCYHYYYCVIVYELGEVGLVGESDEEPWPSTFVLTIEVALEASSFCAWGEGREKRGGGPIQKTMRAGSEQHINRHSMHTICSPHRCQSTLCVIR